MSYMPQSKSDIHPTPQSVWDIIKEKWGHEKIAYFDPCPVNPQWDGLKIHWYKRNYINPPYLDLPLWVIKAFEESDKGKESILLLPAKTDQWWFHDAIIYHNCEIVYIRGRVKFLGNKWAATQPHFLVRIIPRNIHKGYIESIGEKI